MGYGEGRDQFVRPLYEPKIMLVSMLVSYEQKMIDYYAKEQRVSGIRGIKIMSATPQG